LIKDNIILPLIIKTKPHTKWLFCFNKSLELQRTIWHNTSLYPNNKRKRYATSTKIPITLSAVEVGTLSLPCSLS